MIGQRFTRRVRQRIERASARNSLVRLFDRERVEETSLEIVRLEFKVGPVEGHEDDVMPASYVILEEGTSRARLFQRAASATGDQISGSIACDRPSLTNRPCPLVRVNVTVPDDVDSVLLVERNKLPGAKVAPGRAISLP